LILFGEKWLPSVPILRIVAVVTLVTLLRQFSDLLQVAIGRPAKNFQVQLQAFIMSLVGMAMGSPWGMVTTAIGWSLRVVPLCGTSAIYLRQATGMSISDQLKPVVLPLTSGVIMIAAIEAVRYFGPGNLHTAFNLALQLIAGAFAYCIAMALIDRDARTMSIEAAHLIQKK
jgi:PST family polysaccharide transporter